MPVTRPRFVTEGFSAWRTRLSSNGFFVTLIPMCATRLPSFDRTVRSFRDWSRTASRGGTLTMICAWPLSSWATRVASSETVVKTSFASAGRPPRYCSKRVSVMLWPGTCESNRYGPVPTGFFAMSLPYFARAAGLTANPWSYARCWRNAPKGLLQHDANRLGIGRVDAINRFKISPVWQRFLGIEDSVEARLHGRGIEGRPVVELDAATELEGPREPVLRHGPLAGQLGDDLPVLGHGHEALVDVAANRGGGRAGGNTRIERRHGDTEGHRDDSREVGVGGRRSRR